MAPTIPTGSTQIPLTKKALRPLVYPRTKSGLTVKELRDDHLFGVDLRHPRTKKEMPKEMLWARIRDMEDRIEKQASIRFQPTVIRAEPEPETDKNLYDEIEPAYDYEVHAYDAYRWGFLKLNKTPVTEILDFQFAYPNRTSITFDVPLSWVRIDPRFGLCRIVPDHGGAVANFSSYMLSIFSQGRGVPQSIYITYRVGNPPEWWRENHADLLDALLDLSAAEIIQRVATYKAQSGKSRSVSADGLSQSIGGVYDALMGQAKELRTTGNDKLSKWRDYAKGPRLMVL